MAKLFARCPANSHTNYVVGWMGYVNSLYDVPRHRAILKLREQADGILVGILSKWQQTQLFRQSRKLLSKFFDDFETTQRASITELYDLESYRLFTINDMA